jgi:hypothetical protein
MKTLKVRITLMEDMLGTASNDKEIHREFIASKAPNNKTIEEEVASIGVEAVLEKQMTVFPRQEGKPFIYDYQIKGFFKDACSSLARVPGTKSNKLKAYKKIIDGTVFVNPRRIFFDFESGRSLGNCQRPLRAQTAQGERIALANSETIPEGTMINFDVVLLDEGSETLVKEWLDYGQLRGLGQWRNSGKGRFKVVDIKCE